MSIRIKIVTVLLGSVLALTVARGATAGATAPADLFGTKEIRNANLRPFPKWTGMLQRYLKDAKAKPGPCTAKAFNKCHAERWMALIDRLQDQDLATQVQAVNTFMNEAPYIIDPVNWGLKDYWATPSQFFGRNGDCEDYAIAKYLTLKRLGTSPANMRIVVLQDLNLRIAHAVLAVYTGDGIMILDNQISRAVQASVIRHYKPIFSINEDAWWLHRGWNGNRPARPG